MKKYSKTKKLEHIEYWGGWSRSLNKFNTGQFVMIFVIFLMKNVQKLIIYLIFACQLHFNRSP